MRRRERERRRNVGEVIAQRSLASRVPSRPSDIHVPSHQSNRSVERYSCQWIARARFHAKRAPRPPITSRQGREPSTVHGSPSVRDGPFDRDKMIPPPQLLADLTNRLGPAREPCLTEKTRRKRLPGSLSVTSVPRSHLGTHIDGNVDVNFEQPALTSSSQNAR